MALREHIEHTLLKPDAQVRDIEKLCKEAKQYGLLGVCVNPCYVEMASQFLTGTDVKVVTVIGFPLGQN
ncbi:MAG: 2-deoxyribose-5-phosphate aldolase, partial [Succiniclasticum sp.]